MINFTATLATNGNSFWSDVAKNVDVQGLDIRAQEYMCGGKMRRYGELKVYFDTDAFHPNHWSLQEHGLIYTDEGFEAELHKVFESMGITAEASYSEQGMQGNDYVSFDIDEEFITQFDRAFNTATFYNSH